MDAVTTAAKYTGSSVRLTITNTGNTQIIIKINTGVILKPDNPAYQQLVLPGGETLTLKAHEKGEIDAEVFCNNAIKDCPVAGLHYSYYRIGGEELLKVLEYVREHALFDHLGQTAVWSITNYLPLSCVYDSSNALQSENIIAYIAEVTKREKPKYFITYNDYEKPGQRACMGRTEKIYVPFDITLNSSETLSVSLYNLKGVLVKEIAEPQLFDAGKHHITAIILPGHLEASKYIVKLKNTEKTLQEREIKAAPWVMLCN